MTTHACGKESFPSGAIFWENSDVSVAQDDIRYNRIICWFRMGMLKQVVGHLLAIKYHRITKIA